jgi:hypothetical protein
MFKISFKWFNHLSCEIFQTKSIVSKSLFKRISSLSLHSKGFTKVYKIPPSLDPKPSNHSFPFLYCHQGISIPRMDIEIVSDHSLGSSCKIILVTNSLSISLSFSSVYSLYSNHPRASQEVACMSQYVMHFCNQVLFLTYQGHTFMWSTVDAPIEVPAINQSFLDQAYTIRFLLIP